MPWYHAVAESDHEIQNPSSPEKIRMLGERMRLGPDSHLLDAASGMAGPAILLAAAFGCRITCVERADEFHEEARRRVDAANLGHLIELVHMDASRFPVEHGTFDAAMCLGASFVWEDLAGTLEALVPAVKRGGSVAVGEPYWRSWPLPAHVDAAGYEGFATLSGTAEIFASAGLSLTAIVDASLDDWDRYETLKWTAVERWLADHPDDPGAGEVQTARDDARMRYLEWQRELFGWAIFVARRSD